MKNLLTIALCLLLTGLNVGCASIKRHPALYGMAAGAVIGGSIALATRHNCPNTYEGQPYQGTPPCPK